MVIELQPRGESSCLLCCSAGWVVPALAGAQWQADRECRAFAGAIAGGADRASVQLNQMFADRQSESQSRVLPRDGRVGLAEAVEDKRQKGLIDAHAVVADADFGMLLDVLDLDLDSAALRRELHGVGQQIPDYLAQPVWIAIGKARRGGRDFHDRNALRVCRRLHRQDRGVHDFLQVGRPYLEARRAGDDPAHVEKVIDDARLSPRVALDDLQPADDFRRERVGMEYLCPADDRT